MKPYRILFLDDETEWHAQLRETFAKYWTPDFLMRHWSQRLTQLPPTPLDPPELRTNTDLRQGMGGLRHIVSGLYDNDRDNVLTGIDVLILDLELDVRHVQTDVRISGAVLGEQIWRSSPGIRPILLSQHDGREGLLGLEIMEYRLRGLGENFPKHLVIGFHQDLAAVGLFFMTLIRHGELRRKEQHVWTRDRFYEELIFALYELLPHFERNPGARWQVGGRPSKRKFLSDCSRQLVEQYKGKIPADCYPTDHNPQVILRQISHRQPELFERLSELDPGR